jgi:excisionase family DNA binding protein
VNVLSSDKRRPTADTRSPILSAAPQRTSLSAATPFSVNVMTLQEVADYLRVTRSTIHRLLKRNEIPAFRIGRHWRFNVEEIARWSSSHASNG